MPNLATEDRQLTVGQVARILGVSESTVRRYTEKGVIPSTRTLGGQRRYKRADLDGLPRLTEGA